MTTTQQLIDLTEVRDLAIASTRNLPITEHTQAFVLPDGYRVHIVDSEDKAPRPSRASGRRDLYTPESLIDYIARYRTAGTVVFADPVAQRITAIIDSHDDALTPGWEQHKATFSLRRTREWKEWRDHDGKWMSQEEFTLFVEDHRTQIVKPDGASLRELVQTFKAKKSVQFEESKLIASGESQLVYREEIKGGGGAKGDLTIPETLTLGIPPFQGRDAFRVEALLRYDIRDGRLRLSYRLRDADRIEDQVFDDAHNQITEGAVAHDVPVYVGIP